MRSNDLADRPPTALVVDDDRVSLNMMCYALRSVGFECIEAINGNDALAKLVTKVVDLVVSDLKMPGRNGHSLAVELLEQKRPPLIAIHTGVTESRITEDLMYRGVADIVFKPANYELFAAKMRGLVRHHRNVDINDSVQPLDGCGDDEASGRVSLEALRERLKTASHLLPLSQAAWEVVKLIRDDKCLDVNRIAAIIKQDPALCCEVVRLANATAAPTERVGLIDICAAINLLGTRRIVEAAVGVHAISLLTKSILPWLDPQILLANSQCTQFALDRIYRAVHGKPPSDGMALAAMHYCSGRLLLGMLYPAKYRAFIRACDEEGASLSELEHRFFPLSPACAFAEMMTNWNVPKEFCKHLEYLDRDFTSLSHLPRWARDDAELLKTCIIVGQCVSGAWHSWDNIEIPPSHILNRIGRSLPGELIREVSREHASRSLNGSESVCNALQSGAQHSTNASTKQILYSPMSSHANEFVIAILRSMGFDVVDVGCRERIVSSRSVVNCLEVPSTIIAAKGGLVGDQHAVFVSDRELPQAFSNSGQLVRLPTSYSAFKYACSRIVSQS